MVIWSLVCSVSINWRIDPLVYRSGIHWTPRARDMILVPVFGLQKRNNHQVCLFLFLPLVTRIIHIIPEIHSLHQRSVAAKTWTLCFTVLTLRLWVSSAVQYAYWDINCYCHPYDTIAVRNDRLWRFGRAYFARPHLFAVNGLWQKAANHMYGMSL